MSLITLPYIARLMVWFLLDQAEVTDLVGTSVFTDIPSTPTFPVVRVTAFPGHVISGETIYWLESTPLQIDAWGPGGNDRLNAHTIAELCRATIQQRLSGAVTAGGESAVVTGVDLGGIADDSDTTFSPARPRSRFDAVVTAHPFVLDGS